MIKPWKENFSNLIVGITTRYGGTSNPPYGTLNMGLHVNDDEKAVIKNRNHLAELIQFPPSLSKQMINIYSHRRDQGQTGRMLGFIGCR